MANTTFYERGNAYHDSAGNPAIIKNGNELTFTDNFNVGGGGTPYTPPAYSTEEVNTGRKWIDGKDIYEKVITLETTLTVSRNGSDTHITPVHETMISAKGNASNGACINFMEFVQDGTIHLACSNDFAVNNIIFEYTKPTPTEATNNRTVKKASKKG